MESSVASKFEGALLKDSDPFAYFMLVAFDSPVGLVRFSLVLLIWPVIRLLGVLGMEDGALRLMIFVSLAGLRESEVLSISRAVLPKFYMDDIHVDAWRMLSGFNKRVVVTRMPRIMVEVFAREYLRVDEVIGTELVVNRFGYLTGFTKSNYSNLVGRVAMLFSDKQPSLGMGRPGTPFLSLCKEQVHPPFVVEPAKDNGAKLIRPKPVIFHDGRLIKRPTPAMALLILLWIPLGIMLAIIRILVGLIVPLHIIPALIPIFGGKLVVKGKPPPPVSDLNMTGVLFACSHRTLMDPLALSVILGRKIPAATYHFPRSGEILSPIPTVRLTRNREVDADKIKRLLTKGDFVVCPEGATCREPFVLRFSALFAELTDRIVPVAMNCHVQFFHANTARGCKGLDPIFFMMNPRPSYEVTFLNQLPIEATCSSGKSPHDVANYVQKILAATLGFEPTNLTRKDKYRVLTGHDGTFPCGDSSVDGIGKKS